MSPHRSAVDAIGPAVETTKHQLFEPFRYRRWLRLAVVAMSTGELTGGSSGGWSSLTNIHGSAPGNGNNPSGTVALLLNLPGFGHWMQFYPWIVAGVLVLIALGLAFLYVSSVFRFVLFDSVLYNRCEIRPGWRRWQEQGKSYFLWTLGFGLIMALAMGAVIGGPLYGAWLAGIFSQPGDHLVLLVVGGLVLLLATVLLLVGGALAALVAKDFVVPVMALENLRVLEGWRRVLPMVTSEKGACAVYVLMKMVLAVGLAMVFAIIDFLVLIALLLPVGLLALIAVLAGGAAGLTWNTLTLCAAVVAGGALLMLLVYIMSLVSTPAMVFFQAYTLHFLGPRYPLLGQLLNPDSPLAGNSPPLSPLTAPAT